MSDNSTNFALIVIVALVAIVALVVLLKSGSFGSVPNTGLAGHGISTTGFA